MREITVWPHSRKPRVRHACMQAGQLGRGRGPRGWSRFGSPVAKAKVRVEDIGSTRVGVARSGRTPADCGGALVTPAQPGWGWIQSTPAGTPTKRPRARACAWREGAQGQGVACHSPGGMTRCCARVGTAEWGRYEAAAFRGALSIQARRLLGSGAGEASRRGCCCAVRKAHA